MTGASTTKVDKRREKSSATRRALIEATIRSIAAHGLSKTTLSSVSDLSGMSRGLVGFHFKSKNQMLADTLQFLENEYDRAWRAQVVDVDLSPAAKVLASVDFDLEFVSEHPTYLSAWYAFWGEARGNQLYREIILPRDRVYVAHARTEIGKIIDEGNYQGISAEVVAVGLNAIINGLWLELHLDPEAFDFRQARAVYASYLAGLFPGHFPLSADRQGKATA